jgi:hypothetical protein
VDWPCSQVPAPSPQCTNARMRARRRALRRTDFLAGPALRSSASDAIDPRLLSTELAGAPVTAGDELTPRRRGCCNATGPLTSLRRAGAQSADQWRSSTGPARPSSRCRARSSTSASRWACCRPSRWCRRDRARAVRCSATPPCRSVSGATTGPRHGPKACVCSCTSSTATRTSRSSRLAATVPEAELFVYPGTEHYFAEHDDQAAALLAQRVLGLLDSGRELQ